MLDRTAQVGGGRRVIDDQGQACGISDGGDGVQIGNVASRVRDGFAEHSTRVIIDGCFHGIQIIEINKLGGPAEAFDGLAELGDRTAVETGRHNHIVAGHHQREEGHDLGRVAR